MTDTLLSTAELATLQDTELVALIEARSNLDGDAAREALAILRGEIPEDTVV